MINWRRKWQPTPLFLPGKSYWLRILVNYSQLIYDKGAKTIQCLTDSLFNKRCWENWTATCRKMKLAHTFTAYTKWIKDQNVRLYTIKLEENISKTLSDIDHSNIFFDALPRILEIKTKINKWDWQKHKRFCTEKETINKKTTYGLGENICK